jgi:hypothetical protein
MDLSCELPKLSCLKKPTKSDIDKLKEANIVPNNLIDSIFKDLEKDYSILKKKTKSRTKTKTKTKGGKKSSYRKNMRTKRMGTKKRMFGGELTKFQKDKITDMVILLVAGSSYWTVIPVLEAWIISIGILPKLCGQNMMEHISSSLFAAEGQTCAARSQRYNTIMTGFVALITGSAWYQKNKFTKENLSKKYDKIHHYVKKKLFGPSETPTPPRTPTPSPPRESEPSRRRQGEASRSRHQEQQYQEEQQYDQDDTSGRGQGRSGRR